ncbi:ROK family protein [Micromonospora echinospora]|uniref:ROK family transcriptional regulator n=1 Tax=Micromonospora echinospora TaxID=1877 RepID=UPI0033DEE080
MPGTSAGDLLALVRSGQAHTRGELQRVTGLSRSTVGQRLDRLIQGGYLRERGVNESSGGRPSIRLEFNDQHGVVLVADLGATYAHLAVLDLAGRSLAEERVNPRIADGPAAVLDWIGDRHEKLLTIAGRRPDEVRGIGLGVPGPVDFATGRVRQPPIMPGWDDYPIVEHQRRRYPVPVLVDNDANLMALGEQSAVHPHCPAVVLVKVATGIGAGVVVNGAVYRGIDGGAGDLGHIRLHGYDTFRCMCGSYGCLAAVASGGALAQQLSAAGTPTASSREFLARVTAGDPDARRLARTAGQRVGEVLATVVCLLNPGVLVIAGDLAETHFVTGVRELLYQRALPRATQRLTVTTSRLGERAGIVGAHAMVVDSVYAPEAVNRQLSDAPDARNSR